MQTFEQTVNNETSETPELASWNRPRSTEELLSFIDLREARLASVEI